MRNSLVKLTQVGLPLIVVLSFLATASGQTGRIWKYGGASVYSPSVGWRTVMEVYDRSTGQLISQFYTGEGYQQQTPNSGCGTEVHGRGVAYDPTDGNLWITVGIGFNGGDVCGDGWIHKISRTGDPILPGFLIRQCCQVNQTM